MGKLAFVFAGQGAQTVGMGKELAENFPIADKTFDEASEALGFDIKDMIWNGDSETLMITENNAADNRYNGALRHLEYCKKKVLSLTLLPDLALVNILHTLRRVQWNLPTV